jgi:signal transduction histidine kinase
VRSERLASVGYLAAGVAHEINNPIGIIAGYAEFCLQQLAKQNGKDAVAEAEKSLRVINDEAFRCKQIVQKLLTLARPGEESRGNISLGQVASDVVSIVTGLRQFQDRRIDLRVHEADDLRVVASEGEMKQVVLNLTLNALEAVDGTGAPVSIEVRRSGDVVELCVTDSGKGMTSEVLERAFEPFFTAKRGSARPGTGLGLSISHAIVDSHGGRIAAQSAGPGKGSSFTVQLPAANGGPS